MCVRVHVFLVFPQLFCIFYSRFKNQLLTQLRNRLHRNLIIDQKGLECDPHPGPKMPPMRSLSELVDKREEQKQLQSCYGLSSEMNVRLFLLC